MRIYTVVFDTDVAADGERIGPLIYAEDLSSNGSLWNGLCMGYRRGTVLLTSGDVLTLAERTSFTYHGRYEQSGRPLSSLVTREAKVWSFPFLEYRENRTERTNIYGSILHMSSS